LHTSVLVASLAQADDVATRAVTVCGSDADGHLRPERAVLILRSRDQAAPTGRDADLARRVTAAVHGAGLRTDPGISTARSLQLLEIAIGRRRVSASR
jgi:4a-hydroxytetrahydrobiopterin dehydratase